MFLLGESFGRSPVTRGAGRFGLANSPGRNRTGLTTAAGYFQIRSTPFTPPHIPIVDAKPCRIAGRSGPVDRPVLGSQGRRESKAISA